MGKKKGIVNNPAKVYDWDEDFDQTLPPTLNRPNAVSCFSTPDGIAINFGKGVDEVLSRVYVEGYPICNGEELFDFLAGFDTGSDGDNDEPPGGGGIW